MNRVSTSLRWVALSVVAGTLLLGAVLYLRNLPTVSPTIHPPATIAMREQRARARFAREHPDGQPLNVAIGRAAVRFHETKPMGKFVLGLGWDDRGNDCSDFVKCVVDEGIGLKARFKRDSDRHLIGDSYRYQYDFYWDRAAPLLPGDIVSVQHSPWYDPYPGACWHVGIIGADGMVYDFVKLKRWKEARYGRNKLEWFVRHAQGKGEVLVRRLLPEYRYRVWEIEQRVSEDAEDDGDG